MAFTIFYDGQCPLCEKEMRYLMKRNVEGKLAFEDIMAEDFQARFPALDWQALYDRLHGMEADGSILVGLDVTHRAWSLIGKPWLYAATRWPVIRYFADKGYLFFAKHRGRISYWLTGEKPCDTNCKIKY